MPKPIGAVAAFGESDTPSRSDHVHALDATSLAALLKAATANGAVGVTTAQINALIADEAARRQAADAGLSSSLADEATIRAAADADLEARKINIGTGLDATRVLVGENTSTAGGDANLTWDGTTLNVEGTVDANTLRADDMTGTGERVTVAQADGTLRDVDEVTWDGTLGLLRITKSSAQNGLEVWNGQDSGVATWVAKAATGHAMVAEAYGSSAGGTYGGRSRNDSVAFLGANYLGSGTALKNVFYGTNQSDTSAVVSFLAAFTEEAYYTQTAGWTFRQDIQVTSNAGTGVRGMFAQADGHLQDVDEITWLSNEGLSVRTDANGYRLIRLKNANSGSAASAHWTAENNNTVQAFIEAYSSTYVSGTSMGGQNRANGAAFVGNGADLGGVFYGVHTATGAPKAYFVWKDQTEADFDANGWRFNQQIQVTADAGTGVRAVFAQADGHHAPEAAITRTTGELTVDGTPLRDSLASALSYAWGFAA